MTLPPPGLRSAVAVAVLLVAGPLAPVRPAPGDWAGYRGPDGRGVVSDLPADAASAAGVGLKLAWKRPLGSGYSGVAVAGGIVATAYSDGVDDLLAAWDESSGELLWRVTLDETYRGHDGSHDGPISTPLIAHGNVYVVSPRGRFVAVEAGSGREKWSTHLVDDEGAAKPHYGFGTSPLAVGDSVVINLGGPHAVAAFDARSGARRWTAGSGYVQYQSPVLHTLADGRRVILASSDEYAYALLPASGEIVWQHRMNEGLEGMEAHDPRGPGSQSLVALAPDRLLLKLSGDQASVVRLTPGDGGQLGSETVWSSNAIRNTYAVPVAIDGRLFATSSRFLTCVDGASGEPLWRSRQPGDGFPILVGGLLVHATKDGGVYVARASLEGYEQIAGLEVFEDLIWAPPAYARGAIFVRSFDGIARVDLVAAGGSEADGPARAARPADGAFAAMLAEVAQADDKAAVIDAFLARHPERPIIEGERAHFVYRGPAEDLALGSELSGGRQEQPMARVAGTDLFYLSVALEPDARINYVFLRDYVDIVDPGNPRRDVSLAYTKAMDVSFGRKPPFEMSWMAMPGWRPSPDLEAPDGPRGELVEHEVASDVTGGALACQVYLPAGYRDDAARRYPVVYVTDGGHALERGQLANVLDNVCGRRAEPVIAVCMVTPPRFGDPRFGAALVGDVVPFIDREYRTRAGAEGRALMGCGFLAAQALSLLLEHPDTFSAAGLQAPFLLRSFEESYGTALAALEEPGRLRVHLGWGRYEVRNPHEAWDMAAIGRTTDAALRAAGLAVTGGEDRMGTGWGSWKHRLGDMLAALFPRRAPQ